MTNLSEHFTKEEFCYSDTAKKYGQKNEPTAVHLKTLIHTCQYFFEPLRALLNAHFKTYNNKPVKSVSIVITSGYRSKTVNDLLRKEGYNPSSTSQHCLDKQTEILTTQGWKNINTIKSTDQVLNYNIEANIIEPDQINQIIKYHYKGDLIQSVNKHVDICVTPNHRLYVAEPSKPDTFKIKLAKDIYKSRRMHKVAEGTAINKSNINIHLLRLCMAVISDGCVCSKSGKCLSLRFFLKKLRDRQELEDILTKLNMPYTMRYCQNRHEQGCPGVYEYNINTKNSKEVISIIQAKKKKIPQWFVTNLSSEEQWELIKTYAKFDGSFDLKPNRTNLTIFSIDKENIERLQQMCILSGHRCILKTHQNVYKKIFEQEYQMPFFYQLHISNHKTSICKQSSYNKIPYNDLVWCVNTNNGTIITRRNGKVVIMGNCTGEAGDFDVYIKCTDGTKYKLPYTETYTLIKNWVKAGKLSVDQLICEKSGASMWVHASYKAGGATVNRKQFQLYKDGKYILDK